MRIALITREYPPETLWGGIGTHYAALARGLKDAGCDIEVFTQGLQNASVSDEGGILVHRVLPRKWGIGKRSGGGFGGGSLSTIGLFAFSLAVEMYRNFSKRHKENPFDLVEGHEHLGVNSVINRRFKGSLATVTRYQTAYHSMVIRKLANWPASFLIRFLEGTSIKSAGFRIATSRFIDSLTRNDFPGTPVADIYIPNLSGIKGSDPDAYDRDFLIIFVGRMMPGHKNPDMAANAFAAVADRHPQWRIEFAGYDVKLSGNETMWDKCRTILHPYEGRYHYHGFLEHEPLKELYKRARILIAPSSIESYGLVAQEAMAMGCVPVVSDNTSLPEVVGNAGLVFKNGVFEDLVLKLESLMSDLDEQKTRAFECRRRVERVFDQSIIVKDNLTFFRKILQLQKNDHL